jgi:hypothetical protein
MNTVYFQPIARHSLTANAKVLLSGGASRNYGSTLAQKVNSSSNAEMWNVCPTCSNTMLAAVKFLVKCLKKILLSRFISEQKSSS